MLTCSALALKKNYFCLDRVFSLSLVMTLTSRNNLGLEDHWPCTRCSRTMPASQLSCHFFSTVEYHWIFFSTAIGYQINLTKTQIILGYLQLKTTLSGNDLQIIILCSNLAFAGSMLFIVPLSRWILSGSCPLFFILWQYYTCSYDRWKLFISCLTSFHHVFLGHL